MATSSWGFVHEYSVNDRVGRTRDWGSRGTIIECLPNCEVYRVVFDHTWENNGVLVTGTELYPI